MSNSILFKNRNCVLNPPAFMNLRPGLRHHTAAPLHLSGKWPWGLQALVTTTPPSPRPRDHQHMQRWPPCSQLWVLQLALSSRSSWNLDSPEDLMHWALPPLSRPPWGKELPWESKTAYLAGTRAHSYQRAHHWELAEGCPFLVQFHGPALSLQAGRGPTQPPLHREHCCPGSPTGSGGWGGEHLAHLPSPDTCTGRSAGRHCKVCCTSNCRTGLHCAGSWTRPAPSGEIPWKSRNSCSNVLLLLKHSESTPRPPPRPSSSPGLQPPHLLGPVSSSYLTLSHKGSPLKWRPLGRGTSSRLPRWLSSRSPLFGPH